MFWRVRCEGSCISGVFPVKFPSTVVCSTFGEMLIDDEYS